MKMIVNKNYNYLFIHNNGNVNLIKPWSKLYWYTNRSITSINIGLYWSRHTLFPKNYSMSLLEYYVMIIVIEWCWGRVIYRNVK